MKSKLPGKPVVSGSSGNPGKTEAQFEPSDELKRDAEHCDKCMILIGETVLEPSIILCSKHTVRWFEEAKAWRQQHDIE